MGVAKVVETDVRQLCFLPKEVVPDPFQLLRGERTAILLAENKVVVLVVFRCQPIRQLPPSVFFQGGDGLLRQSDGPNSGWRQISSKLYFFLISRYSGSYRPVCLIYHTGTRSTFCPRQARMNKSSYVISSESP